MLLPPSRNARVRKDPWGPKPGATAVPAGHIRMFHYTPGDSFESVVSGGVRLNEAKGDSYGEPNAVWGSTKMPPQDAHFVEAHIPFDEYKEGSIGLPETYTRNRSGVASASDEGLREYNEEDHNFALPKDVPPERIVAKSAPYMHTTRYIEENGGPPGGGSATAYYDFPEGTMERKATDAYDERHPQPKRRLLLRPDQTKVRE